MSKLVKYELDPLNPPELTEAQRREIEALAAMKDEDIDFSDIPRADETFWANAKRNPYYKPIKHQLILRLDADVIAWFKRQTHDGRGYQRNINQALRTFIEDQEKKAG